MVAYKETRIRPLLSVNVVDCTGETAHLANLFSLQLCNRDLGELSRLTCQIAKDILSGRLSSKPAVMGIVVQCLDKVKRLERGVITNKRPRNMGPLEASMVEEAAMLLVLNGMNATAVTDLGFSKEATLRSHGRVSNLLEQGLPCPALALLRENVLRENISIVDSMLPRRPGSGAMRRLVFCLDFTYLLPMLSVMNLHGERCVVGGAFKLDDIVNEDKSCIQVVHVQQQHVGQPHAAGRRCSRFCFRHHVVKQTAGHCFHPTIPLKWL